MSNDAKFATTDPILFPAESAPRVVEQITIDGVELDIVNYAVMLTRPASQTDSAAPTFGYGDRFYAIERGAQVHALGYSFYLVDGPVYDFARDRKPSHLAGDVRPLVSRAAAVFQPQEIGEGKTLKAAITSARNALKLREVYRTLGPVAEANIRTVSGDEFHELDADATIARGDLVVIHSHGRMRLGVAYHVTSTGTVKALIATPTSKVAQGASAKQGVGARLYRKAVSAAPALRPVEERVLAAAERSAAAMLDALGTAVGDADAKVAADTDPNVLGQLEDAGFIMPTRTITNRGLDHLTANGRFGSVEARNADAVALAAGTVLKLPAPVTEVPDVDGNPVRVGDVVECVGAVNAVLTGKRGLVVRVSRDVVVGSAGVELKWPERGVSRTSRAANRVRLVPEGGGVVTEVLDGNGDRVEVPEGMAGDELRMFRVFMAGRVPARKCPHYIATSEDDAGIVRCEQASCREDAPVVGCDASAEYTKVVHAGEVLPYRSVTSRGRWMLCTAHAVETDISRSRGIRIEVADVDTDHAAAWQERYYALVGVIVALDAIVPPAARDMAADKRFGDAVAFLDSWFAQRRAARKSVPAQARSTEDDVHLAGGVWVVTACGEKVDAVQLTTLRTDRVTCPGCLATLSAPVDMDAPLPPVDADQADRDELDAHDQAVEDGSAFGGVVGSLRSEHGANDDVERDAAILDAARERQGDAVLDAVLDAAHADMDEALEVAGGRPDAEDLAELLAAGRVSREEALLAIGHCAAGGELTGEALAAFDRGAYTAAWDLARRQRESQGDVADDARDVEVLNTAAVELEQAVLDECTHGADCGVHRGVWGLHNFDADTPAAVAAPVDVEAIRVALDAALTGEGFATNWVSKTAWVHRESGVVVELSPQGFVVSYPCSYVEEDDGGAARVFLTAGTPVELVRDVARGLVLVRAAEGNAEPGRAYDVDDLGDELVTHDGLAVNDRGVSLRTLPEVLWFEPYEGGAWRFDGQSMSDLGEGDVREAQAWAADHLGRGDYDVAPVAVVRWQHHTDRYGDWWTPVV